MRHGYKGKRDTANRGQTAVNLGPGEHPPTGNPAVDRSGSRASVPIDASEKPVPWVGAEPGAGFPPTESGRAESPSSTLRCEATSAPYRPPSIAAVPKRATVRPAREGTAAGSLHLTTQPSALRSSASGRQNRREAPIRGSAKRGTGPQARKAAVVGTDYTRGREKTRASVKSRRPNLNSTAPRQNEFNTDALRRRKAFRSAKPQRRRSFNPPHVKPPLT